MEAYNNIKTEEQLRRSLQTLVPLMPPSQNPYTRFRTALTSAVSPPQPKSTAPLLILSSIGAGIAFLLFIAIWVIRWRKGTFWVARITRAGNEPYLLFHYQNAWAIVASFMLLSFQGYVWELYRLHKGAVVGDLLLWVTLCWMPGVVSEIIACWTLVTTYILHCYTYSFGKRTTTPFYFSSLFVSTIFAFSIVAYIIILVVYSVDPGKHYSDMSAAYIEANAILATAETSWAGKVDLSVFDRISPAMFVILVSSRDLIWSFRRAFIINCSFAIGIELLFLLVAVTYIRCLKSSLKEFAGKSPTGVKAFTRTLHGLVAITASFVLYITLVSVNGIWVAVLSGKVLTLGVYTQLSAIVPTLTVIAGALLIGVVMLYQTLTSPPVYYVSPAAARPTTVLPIPTKRLSSSDSIPRRPSADASLSQHYIHFALASSEPLPSLAFLTFTPPPAPDSHRNTQPFENFELQPQRSRSSSGGESVLSSWKSGSRRERRNSVVATGSAEGVLVTREQVVSVVNVGAHELDIEELKRNEAEEEQGWRSGQTEGVV